MLSKAIRAQARSRPSSSLAAPCDRDYNATNLTSGSGVAVSASTNTLTDNGGTIAPGDLGVTGKTTITGNLAMLSGTFAADVAGTTASGAFQDAAGTGKYDNIAVSGSTNLTGNNFVNVNYLSGASAFVSSTETLLTTTALGGSGTFTIGTVTGGPFLGTATIVDTANSVLLVNTANAAPGTAYFTGLVSSTWNSVGGSGTNATINFSSDSAGLVSAGQLPGATTNVHFYSTNANTANLSNSLGQAFTINSLTVDGTALNGENIAVTISDTNSLTLQATGSNGNTVGNGITVGAGAGALRSTCR